MTAGSTHCSLKVPFKDWSHHYFYPPRILIQSSWLHIDLQPTPLLGVFETCHYQQPFLISHDDFVRRHGDWAVSPFWIKKRAYPEPLPSPEPSTWTFSNTKSSWLSKRRYCKYQIGIGVNLEDFLFQLPCLNSPDCETSATKRRLLSRGVLIWMNSTRHSIKQTAAALRSRLLLIQFRLSLSGK